MILQHNPGAANAARQYHIVIEKQRKGAEKLSTGYRINRAADDAAGLTISESMRYMIRGAGKASDNAQHGISLLQTADGALNESQQVIHRIRELSVQAANDTNTESDREAIQKEVASMLSEVDRIANDTEFNTIKLLDGTLEALPYQSSPILIRGTAQTDAMQQAAFEIAADPIVGAGVKLNNTQVAGLNEMLVNSIVPQAVNAFLKTFPVFQTAAGANQVSNQIGLKLYGDTSTTLASVSIKYARYSNGTIAGDSIQLNLSVNTRALSFSGNDLTPESRTSLETTIVHEMMHAFMDDTLTNGMIGATDGKADSANQFPGWFKEGMAQCAAGGCANYNDWVNGALKLNENSTTDQISAAVKSSANRLSSNSTASKYGTGYLACMYLSYLAAGKPAALDSAGLAGGINQIFEKLINGDSLNNIVKDISGGTYTSVTDFRNKFGDNASAEFISKLLKAVGNTGNGGVVASLTADDLLSDNNAASPVFQVDDTKEFVVSSVGNNRNWGTGGANKTGSGFVGGSTGGPGGTGGPSGPSGPGGGTGGTGGGPGGPAGTNLAGALNLQIGAREGNAFAISIDDMHAAVLGIENLSVRSFDDAGMAITACDNALTKISENRSRIGAYINRLEYAVNNLENTAENTQAAESLIRDSDMADEMVQYSKNQILSQAGQSILSNAVNQPESVLALLG